MQLKLEIGSQEEKIREIGERARIIKCMRPEHRGGNWRKEGSAQFFPSTFGADDQSYRVWSGA